MKIVITGAAGYIGSRLAKKIKKLRHDEICCFDNFRYNQGVLTYDALRKTSFYNEDINNWSDNLKRKISEADVVIPLAALVGAPLCDKYPEESNQTNFEWFKSLLNYLDRQLVVYPNTNSGYGTVEGICTEETPCNPLSLYAQQKQASEILLRQYKNSIVFRLATVFGWSPRMRLDLLVNNLIYEATTQNKILVYNGNARRNYIHVGDICQAFIFAIKNREKMAGQVYNLGNDKINKTKLELVQQICSELGKDYEEVEGNDPDKRDYEVSSQKLYSLGFSPSCELKYTIHQLSNFYKYLHRTDFHDINFYRIRNY